MKSKKTLYLLFALSLSFGGCSEKQFVENITVTKGLVRYNMPEMKRPFKVLFLSDCHITVEDEHGKDFYQYTKRMGGSAAEPQNYGISNGREQTLIASLEKARKDSVRLVVLGGDIINFPSAASVELVTRIMENSGLNWVYIAGNHDWHYEGEPGEATEQRNKWENATLEPLYRGENPLYRSRTIHNINFVFIDNSTNEIEDEQLNFLQNEIGKGIPIVLFMHIPVYFPGQNIDYGCGHPDWNREHDIYYKIERRAPWPEEGHTKTTCRFRDLVIDSPEIIGIFAGHTHAEAVDYYKNKIQYVTRANYNGGEATILFSAVGR